MAKKLKKDYFCELKQIVEKYVEDEKQKKDLTDFLNFQLQLIVRKQQRSVIHHATARRKKGHTGLTELIYEILDINSEWMTAEDVLEFIDRKDVSFQKVSARLTNLVRLELIKKKVTRVNGRDRMSYCIIDSDLEDISFDDIEAEEEKKENSK